MILISVLLAGMLAASLAISILTLLASGRLFRAEKPTLGRAAAVSVILAVPSPLVLVWSNRLAGAHPGSAALLPAIQLLGAWVLIRWLLQAGSGKAVLIGLTWLTASTLFSVGLALVCRATATEAFVVPTGAMAPTVFGQHVEKSCRQCGYALAIGVSFRPYDPEATATTTCTNCGAPVEVLPHDPTIPGDRVLVSKFDSPRRWDLVVFPPPMDPSTMYVKRLVGLPGETLEIRGGDLYANRRRLQKPPGTLDEFWLPVHDTDFAARESASEEIPHWISTVEPSPWQWKPAEGWHFRGSAQQSGELRFSHAVTDRLAYNADPYGSGRRFNGTDAAEEVFVPDLGIACHASRVTGSGVWGFVWEAAPVRVRASISTDGVAAIVLADSASGGSEGPEHQQDASKGCLPLPAAGTTIRFAVRDGQAYLMQDQHLVAVLGLPETTAQPAGEDIPRPVVKLFAKGGELQLSRIQLFRDVYYLTADQVDPYGEPGIPNPVSLAADEFLVLGDNSRMSRDARFFGPIHTDAVQGVVRCTYWPPSRVRAFATPVVPAER